MDTDTRETRAWVGCLGCYNDGRLVGRWVDALEAGDVTVAEIHGRELTGLPADYGHEELWCFDLEGFDGLIPGECSPAEAQRVAEALEGVEEHERGAFAAWVGNGNDINDVDGFREDYAGEWDSEVEYAQELAEEIGAIPADLTWPCSHIDWEAAARDLFIDYWSAPAPGGVYVFRR